MGSVIRATVVVLTLVLGADVVWAENASVTGEGHLDVAQRLVEEADFERALTELEAAVESGGLQRDDVVRLYVIQSLIHHALRQNDELESTLRRLAALDPDFQFEETVPPALIERFSSLSEDATQLALDVEAREIRGGFRIDATVTGDPGGLVERVRISTRVPDGEWVHTDGSRASIPTRNEGAIEFYVHGYGPGGALVVERGSEDEPGVVGNPDAVDGVDVVRVLETPDPVEPEDRSISPWVWVGSSLGVVAVAATVVLAVLLSRQGENTQLDAPEVEWP